MGNLIQSIKDNLTFVLFCLLLTGGLLVLAGVFEHFFMKNRRKLRSAKYIATVAMCSALAGVLMLLEIPLFFAPSFYKLDFSEVPVLFCSFYLGPVGGVLAELLKNLIKILLKGTTTAFVGDFANFAVGCALVLPASIIYHLAKTKKGAIIGLSSGTAIMTVFGSIFNAIYLLPKFAELYGLSLDAIIGMGQQVNPSITSVSTLVLYAVVPLNLLKGVLVSIITFLLYKRVEHAIFKVKS